LKEEQNNPVNYPEVIAKLINVVIILLIVIVILGILLFTGFPKSKAAKEVVIEVPAKPAETSEKQNKYWSAPDTASLKEEPNAKQIRYGRDLIANTAFYYGPKGTLGHSTNGMNCQNCHPGAGTKLFANNYSAVTSTYPKFRERSGTVETIFKRVKECFNRGLNGPEPDTSGAEMQAMVAYIKWLGKNVEKGVKPEGAGVKDLAYMDRAADPQRGEKLYRIKCESCHAKNGEGKKTADGIAYQYPPLWGGHSYNIGAGLYRLSRFAGYIKFNMPQGTTFDNPQLSDEEAWDIAAFVNSQPRPSWNFSQDWPDIAGKPVDHPFGPYADNFSESQHKFGPFTAIASARKK
jgi:thiosulfate dehydrogenase